jgi:hypothetical protein
MDEAKQLINFLQDQMAFTVGLPPMGARFPEPRPPVLQSFAPMTNFNITGGVVGAVNTGAIQQLDVDISGIRQEGHADLAEALKIFAQAILDDRTLAAEMRSELLEQIEFVASEARKPKPSGGAVKAVLMTIAKTVAVLGGLAEAWQKLQPILAQYFPGVFH